jgi:serine/threonine-protein kinase
MEYLPGRSLAELLAAGEPLSLDRALLILRQLADALDYAHEHSVIHRDVKPSNVIVEESRKGGIRVTLTDFGLVKLMGDCTTLTSSGQLLGSPEYMAPEQMEPGREEEIGPLTDCYALGIVAYYMLTGQVPFQGVHQALYGHVNEEPPIPSSVCKSLSVSIDRVLRKALSKSTRPLFQGLKTELLQ